MTPIDPHIPAIRQLCQQHRVLAMTLFGSALTDRFTPHSDIDLMVRFDTTNHEQWDYVANYFALLDSLENLLGRRVDLVSEAAVTNPYFHASVARSHLRIYG